MGMASSDNEAQIARDHARHRHLRNVPQHPGSYEHPATEEQMAYYHHALAQWAAELPSAHEEWNGGYLA